MRHSFRRESEAAYTLGPQYVDSPSRWLSEYGYLSGLANDQATPTAEKPWYQSAVETLVPAATAIYTQRELNKLNIERARQGLAPISASEFARTYQPPVARVQVEPGSQARNLLLWAALGIGGLVALRAAKII